MLLWDTLLPLAPLPRPVTVIASLHDTIKVRDALWAAPVLTIEQGGNKVSLPTFNAWQGGWNHTMPRTLISRGAGDSVAWSDRKPQLVWRGWWSGGAAPAARDASRDAHAHAVACGGGGR